MLSRLATRSGLAGRQQLRAFSSAPGLSESHIMLQQMCRDFADNELAPIAAELDREHRFPTEQVQKMGELGLMGVVIDPEYGGTGMDCELHRALLFAELLIVQNVQIWATRLRWRRSRGDVQALGAS